MASTGAGIALAAVFALSCRGGAHTEAPRPGSETAAVPAAPSAEATGAKPTPSPTPLQPALPSSSEPALVPLPNARLYQGALVGGQPTAEHLRQLKDAGYTTVINLRAAGEDMTDVEPGLVRDLGMTYVSIPVAGAAGLTRQNAEALDRALAEAPGPAVVHCASGNRVGGLFALRAYWLKGKTQQQALAEGARAGMTRIAAAVRAAIDKEPRTD